MDIARGPRRARHVAVTTARDRGTPSGADADGHQPQQHQHQQPPPQRYRRVTPRPPAITHAHHHSHETPPQGRHVPAADGDANDGEYVDADAQPSSAVPAPPPHPFRARRSMPHARLSMPELSDDSGSEPDLSILGMMRNRQADVIQEVVEPEYDAHDQLEADDTSVEEVLEEADDPEQLDVEQEEEQIEAVEEQEVLVDPASLGLKEISNLGRFTVSSHKQGNGVDELRSDDLNLYWQSDGPQPHRLTIYFVKRVGIRDLRFYVNYTEDESYTPTNIIFKSGTSENNLIQFAHLTLNSPVGWQQVSLEGAGGGPDGNTLVSYVLQMQILENHQNGKDTHLRGIKIYAADADSSQTVEREGNPVEDVMDILGSRGDGPRGLGETGPEGGLRLSGLAKRLAEASIETGESGFTIPDFMRDPDIR